ncbi:MAG: hypothetical protein AAB415_01410 [Patescibacteria group bacterium]
MLKKRSTVKSVVKPVKSPAPRKRKLPPLPLAPAGASFWVNNGPALRHLLDLSKFLAIITEEQFRYHTERSGNDFAKWVAAVLGDESCARALETAKTVAAARAAVARSLKRYDA